FAVTTDPITGLRDGILKRPTTDPLVIQLDSESEIWQWRGSLNVVDGNGQPIPLPSNVRLYLDEGFGHATVAGLLAPPTPPGTCQNMQQDTSSSAAYTTLRALTVAMDEWVDQGVLPPPSRYPSLADGSFVTFEQFTKFFPIIPGAAKPSTPNQLNVLDFGPSF